MSQPEPLRFRPIDLTGVYVLVVDDYEDTLELFRSALEAFGAEVVTARSARDALTIMKTARVNAMVSDLAMPGEDGLWLVQQLRRLKSTQGGGIPAIAITAHRERYAAERVREFGFEAFLTKPSIPSIFQERSPPSSAADGFHDTISHSWISFPSSRPVKQPPT